MNPSCKTCAHRFGFFNLSRCGKTGYLCDIERSPAWDDINVCGSKGLLWEPRPSLFQRLVKVFTPS